MGILQTAYKTYENQLHNIGVVKEGKEPLTPVAHAIQKAQIEIVLSADGEFSKAYPIAKEASKTIIPVTIESAGRTGDGEKNPCPHALSDQLRYLAPYGGNKFAAYRKSLGEWANSRYTHPKARAVYQYIQSGSILRDLADVGVIMLNEQGLPGDGKIENTDYEKCLVRFLVQSLLDEGKTACYEDVTLFEAYRKFYEDQCAQKERDICLISGKDEMICNNHPKGVIAINSSAKLISANDASGFTYRGRFTKPEQASNVGYITSQKAHHALRWIAANHGVIVGGRTFLCWNPKMLKVPAFSYLMNAGADSENLKPDTTGNIVDYKRNLLQTLGGYKNALPPEEDVVIAAMDAATTGRLSVTYYNELKASDFFDRVEHWYETFCWASYYGIQSPSLNRIVTCAFGTQRGKFIEADDKLMREHVQRLLCCIYDRHPLPWEIVRALAEKCGNLFAYTRENREMLLVITCAAVRKYYNDQLNKEVWTLALDKNNHDRSYLFGRLLAVGERVERSTYDREEGREPNAIRMQAVFSQRPMYAWRIIHESLNPYFARLSPGLRGYFQKIIEEITDLLTDASDPGLNKKLEDIYLLGYYHQRSAMNRKSGTTEKEEVKNESIGE